MRIKSNSKNRFIPVNTPKIFSNEKKYVNDCLKTGWISSEGQYVKKFEKDFAKFNSRKYGVSTSSGTAALEIALKSLNLKKNSEVIIPTFSIISTALCVIKLGLRPVLVDAEVDSWNMDVKLILKAINKKTKAIILTHIYGFPVDMKKIIDLARNKNIRIIEDAAEMIGQKYRNKMCGSFGDLSTFSFYANKHITTGEGGMILTNNPNLRDKCSSLRNLCFGKGKNRFNHDDIGWNYRLSNLQAALGCGQLKNINWIIKRKREIGRLYTKLLIKNKYVAVQKEKNSYSKNIYWVFGVLLKKNPIIKRDKLIEMLFKKNIQTRNFFYPMHKQNIFRKMKIFSNKKKYPISEQLSKNGFYLPSGLGLKNTEIFYICKTLNKILS